MTRAYARISLDKKTSGSIAKQKERISAAEKAKGRNPENIVWYVDEGVSGSKVALKDRPDGSRLFAELRRGDRVVMTRIDRAARNVMDLKSVVAGIQAAGAEVRFVDNDIDTSGPYGGFMVTMLGALAELEADIIAERVRESQESFAYSGRHGRGDLPFGFMSVPNQHGDGLVVAIDPVKGPMLKDAIRRILAGEPQSKVRHMLGMSETGFSKLLRNPRLCGMTVHRGNIVMVDGAPLINRDAQILSVPEYDALQAFLAKPVKTWALVEGFGPVVTCSTCGERMYENKKPEGSTDRAAYRCRRRKHEKGQIAPTVIVEDCDRHVEDYFLSTWGHMPYAVPVWSDSSVARDEALALADIRIKAIERRMREADSRSERASLNSDLLDAYDMRDEAASIPVEKTLTMIQTDETMSDVWKRSSVTERCNLIKRLGAFTVHPGTKGTPIAERVKFKPAPEFDTATALLSGAFLPEGVSMAEIGRGLTSN